MPSLNVNLFEARQVGKRYARARPYFHGTAMAHLKELLGREGIFTRKRRALDIGCGTGMSTHATLEVAEEVVGIDPAPEMLAEAAPNPQIHYRQCTAENMDFPPASFDLITLSQSSHWIDHGTFFPKAHRVLSPEGFLVAYDCFLSGRTDPPGPFYEWFQKHYLQRYPAPSRHFLSPEGWRTLPRFRFVSTADYTTYFEFSPEKMTHFICTLSNVIHFQRASQIPWVEIESSLLGEIQTALGGKSARFEFTGFVYLLGKGREC